MLSEALQRNAKREARLSNISVYLVSRSVHIRPEILLPRLRDQNDIVRCLLVSNHYLLSDLAMGIIGKLK
jgi:hypothetical protein